MNKGRYLIGTIERSTVYDPKTSNGKSYIQFTVNCRNQGDPVFATRKYRCEAFESDCPDLVEIARKGYEKRKVAKDNTDSCCTASGGLDGLKIRANIIDVEICKQSYRVYYLDHETPIELVSDTSQPEVHLGDSVPPHDRKSAIALGVQFEVKANDRTELI